jgi:hypothetical protein
MPQALAYQRTEKPLNQISEGKIVGVFCSSRNSRVSGIERGVASFRHRTRSCHLRKVPCAHLAHINTPIFERLHLMYNTGVTEQVLYRTGMNEG